MPTFGKLATLNGGQPRWRGRIEHVQSRQQANFLAIEDLLRFWQRFGIGMAVPTDKGELTVVARAFSLD